MVTDAAQFLFNEWSNPAFPWVCVGFLFFVAFGGMFVRRVWSRFGEYLKWL